MNILYLKTVRFPPAAYFVIYQSVIDNLYACIFPSCFSRPFIGWVPKQFMKSPVVTDNVKTLSQKAKFFDKLAHEGQGFHRKDMASLNGSI